VSSEFDRGEWAADDLPANWCWAAFDEFLMDRTDAKRKLPQKLYANRGSLPVVDQRADFIGGYTDDSSNQSLAPLPAIVFGDHTRIVKYIDRPFVQGADGVRVLCPTSAIDPRFAYYALKCLRLPDKGYSRHFKFLKATSFPVAPLLEQRRVVAKIENLSAKSKLARDNLDRVLRLVEKYRQAVLAAAFRGDLTKGWREANPTLETTELLSNRIRSQSERATRKLKSKAIANTDGVIFAALPEGWSYRSIHELYEVGWIIDYADGNHGSLYPRKTDFAHDGVSFVTAEQIARGRVNFSSAPKLSRTKAAKLKKGWSRRGDVLLTHNATVGRVAMVSEEVEDFLLGTSATFYRVDREVIFPTFLYFALQSPVFQDQLASVMVQTTRNQVPITMQALLKLPIPSVVEQEEIARRLQGAFAWIDRLATEATNARKLIDHLDQAVLDKAFLGELVPQDPNDEPANVLLERVQKARQAVGSLSRRKGLPQ
jgi:type I restriction enzyme S subunit